MLKNNMTEISQASKRRFKGLQEYFSQAALSFDGFFVGIFPSEGNSYEIVDGAVCSSGGRIRCEHINTWWPTAVTLLYLSGKKARIRVVTRLVWKEYLNSALYNSWKSKAVRCWELQLRVYHIFMSICSVPFIFKGDTTNTLTSLVRNGNVTLSTEPLFNLIILIIVTTNR